MTRTDPKQLSTLEFALHARDHSGMFFGTKEKVSLSALGHMLWAFNLHATKPDTLPFAYLNHWVKWKLDKSGPMYNWVIAILESCNGDEVVAFWRFFELLDEFLATRPTAALRTSLNEDNFAYYYSSTNKDKAYRLLGADYTRILQAPPYQIVLFQFDYAVHAYHFDYFEVIGDLDTNTYYGALDTVLAWKRRYKEKFGPLKWQKIAPAELQQLFSTTINHCNKSI